MLILILLIVMLILGEIIYGWEENRNGKRKK
nr:MAG TPA: Organic solute transporter subunit beta protein [Caudoviricetes sp.]